jgi:hypothetical protein
MQESDFVIVEKDAKLLPGEARILRRMADLIEQRGLDSLFAFLQPTLVPHTEPIVTGRTSETWRWVTSNSLHWLHCTHFKRHLEPKSKKTF